MKGTQSQPDTSVRFDRNIKDYDGGEDELPEDVDWDSDEWDVDSWDVDADPWTAFVFEDTYPGNPGENTDDFGVDSSWDDFDDSWDDSGWNDSGWDDTSD